ncbi:hypothetical protein [Aliiroseovarius marinus]|uniref:hypothetical protein n=1 Tax=Aliiroseovarius marinus TaxID=2500159 RepID=UPI002494634A|nr:hypothetical protein [Aliiroseovarius marinus]
MTQPTDPLARTGISPATKWRIKRRLAFALMIIGAFPIVLLLLGLVLGVISLCGFDNGPAYCSDINHPAVMIPTMFVMSGMYGIFTLPILVAGGIWWRRLGHRHPVD